MNLRKFLLMGITSLISLSAAGLSDEEMIQQFHSRLTLAAEPLGEELPVSAPQQQLSVDAEVARLRAAVEVANFTRLCALELYSAIDKAKSTGTKSDQIEERAKEFHLADYLTKMHFLATPSRLGAVELKEKSLVQYARALNEAAKLTPEGLVSSRKLCAQQ